LLFSQVLRAGALGERQWGVSESVRGDHG
jgi:hypothetical protein